MFCLLPESLVLWILWCDVIYACVRALNFVFKKILYKYMTVDLIYSFCWVLGSGLLDGMLYEIMMCDV